MFKIKYKVLKYKYLILSLFLSLLVIIVTSCGVQRDAVERQGLMMPLQSEMFRNSGKYKEPTKRKTNKIKVKKAKRKSFF